MTAPIEIVAAVIRDDTGRTLLVRKQGTQVFMPPGGNASRARTISRRWRGNSAMTAGGHLRIEMSAMTNPGCETR